MVIPSCSGCQRYTALLITPRSAPPSRDSAAARVIHGRRRLAKRALGEASTAARNHGTRTMRITLVGSRHFGVTTFDMLRLHAVEIARVVVADGEDRLAAAARAAGIEVTVQADPKLVVAAEIA